MTFSRLLTAATAALAMPATAQVDPDRAARYFDEAAALCERDGGRLWGVSLCGPMVFFDAATQTIAVNQPEPAAPRPRALGFANTALDWGGERWATYWLQLEWRALRAALAAAGADRRAALRDALAFRAERRTLFAATATNESADGPVVTFPRPRGASLITTGAVPIPDAGTVFASYHAEDRWGRLDVDGSGVLVREDVVVVPAPAGTPSGHAFTGDGWSATLAEGWRFERGPRPGDYSVKQSEP